MAWHCSGKTNAELVENLWRSKLITKERVKEAFLRVDRAHYAPSMPYDDSPQPIGHGATISAPHMHAEAAESLLSYLTSASPDGAKVAAPPRILDIGSGSGYLTHVLAELVADRGGCVVGIEHISALRELGEQNMAKSARGRELLADGRVRFRVQDGRKGYREEDEDDPSKRGEQPPPGLPESQKVGMQRKGQGWDAIHVGASAAVLHQELVDQLRAPGRLFIPVNDDGTGWSQHIWVVDKDRDGRVTKTKGVGVRYVPLTDAPTR